MTVHRTRASALAALALAIAAACSDGPTLPDTVPLEYDFDTLAVGELVEDSTWGFSSRDYIVSVTPGVRYVIAAVGLTDSTVVLRSYDGASLRQVAGRSAPKDIAVTAAASRVGVGLVGGNADKGHFAIAVVPAPVATGEITATSGAIPLRTPTVGWVGARGRSRYHASGATGPRTVSLVGLTDDARLRVYSDGGYVSELDCTLRDGARECTVPGPSIHFEVEAGPLNRTGAGYVIIVR